MSIVLSAPVARAADDRDCVAVLDDTPLQVGTLKADAGAKVHFRSSKGKCAKAEPKDCELKAYVMAGDNVLVSRTREGFVCGAYYDKKGRETVGWLPAAAVQTAPLNPNPTPAQWAGKWGDGTTSFNILVDVNGGMLRVTGSSSFVSGDNANLGDLAGAAKPDGNKLSIVDDDCKLTLVLAGTYLIAKDNAHCGGMNVSFDGVTRKL